MAYSNKEEAGTRTPYILRVGLTHPALGGMDKESDRGAVAGNEFFDIQNGRRRGGRWFPRGGQVKTITTPLNPIIGMFDLAQQGTTSSASFNGVCGSGGPAIFGTPTALGGGGAGAIVYDGQSNGFCVPSYDTPTGTGFTNGASLGVDAAGELISINPFSATVGVSTVQYIDLVSIARAPWPITSGPIANVTLKARIPFNLPNLPNGNISLAFFVANNPVSRVGFFRGDTFFSLTNANAGNYFFRLSNGQLFMEFSQTGTGVPSTTASVSDSLVSTFRETVVFTTGPSLNGAPGDAAHANTHPRIWVRDIGANYTTPAFTGNNTNSSLIPASGRVDEVRSFTVNCMQTVTFSGSDLLYIGGWGYAYQGGVNYGPRGVICTWDGTTLKCIRVMETSPASCTPQLTPPFGSSNTVPWGVTNFCVLPDGRLAYTYTNSYPAAACGGVATIISRLGTYNGSSFNDSVENFVTDATFNAFDPLAQLTYLGLYRGRVFVIGYAYNSGSDTYTNLVVASSDLTLTSWVVEKSWGGAPGTTPASGFSIGTTVVF